MKEEWLDIRGYEGVYEVSNLGRVRRMLVSSGTSGGILKNVIQNGYPSVLLSKDGKREQCYIHRLVAGAFMGPIPEGQYVHHLDGNRADSSLANLTFIRPGDHRHHHFMEGIKALQPGKRGDGLTMFD